MNFGSGPVSGRPSGLIITTSLLAQVYKENAQ